MLNTGQPLCHFQISPSRGGHRAMQPIILSLSEVPQAALQD